ncbi:DUF6884 domain-containing protein [Catellatospora citrea]|uniref:DUF6884 domain-containing protein n=1 Tax=Catellatospora citrea TaxID=53366 RepID=A0A8J3KRJ2_9ACTN|nr:DUF6884 domain-containing protein [Catellatospora citrea]GIG02094.1 hypothetical protein Cci01nite_71870 [Catellatospora citrea]
MTNLEHRPGVDYQQRMVVVACSKEKTLGRGALPALDLYDGGVVPPLRQWLGERPGLRSRVRFLSAQHGWITAETRLEPYDRPLDTARAEQLRPHVKQAVDAEITSHGMPEELLVVAEPLYLTLLADLLALPQRPRVFWIYDHAHGWPQAHAVLTDWGW